MFDFLKRKKRPALTQEQLKWNKMWSLWDEGKASSPYSELMRYQSEINNGGHDQYFTNVENTGDLAKELSVLESALSAPMKENLRKAYKAYLILEEADDDEEAENRKTPQNIAHTDKELPLADLVRQRAHQNGGQRSGNGGGHDHVGNIGGAGVEHLVDKDVEIHVFNDPSHLSHKTENGQRQPKPPAQLGFLRRACIVHGITSFVGIIALTVPDCNKNSPPRIRRGVSLYRLLKPNRLLSP